MLFNFFKRETPPTTSLYLRNSATGEKELFVPIRANTVTMYSCGPTVYDHAHIGNMRACLPADLIRRVFTDAGYEVKNTINFTDFGHLSDDGDAGEDKMMKAIKRHDKPVTLEAMKSVAQIYIDSFKKDFEDFGNLQPTTWTPASAFIPQQIHLIKTLVEKGYGYETPDGIYFDVTAFPTYGTLGNIDLEKLKEGARVELNPWKRHPADFALWKKGLLGWESDWGKGFPGWHIECAAMVFSTLGKQIDIHTGGEDLMYTHHNGEIAEVEAITRKPYVHYWVHNAHLSVNGEKIAKSLGNGVTVHALQEKGYSGFDARYLFLTAHYRSPLNFTWESLAGAKTARAKLVRFATEHPAQSVTPHEETSAALRAALRDDLDTPKAIAILWTMMNDATISNEKKAATLLLADDLLCLGLKTQSVTPLEIPHEIQELANTRKAARDAKQWPESDRIRDDLTTRGYRVTDTEEGQIITML